MVALPLCLRKCSVATEFAAWAAHFVLAAEAVESIGSYYHAYQNPSHLLEEVVVDMGHDARNPALMAVEAAVG